MGPAVLQQAGALAVMCVHRYAAVQQLLAVVYS